MSLSGLKDVDREILKYIDDSELLEVCSVNKWFYNNVCDDNFLRRRLMKYPNIEKSRQGENLKKFFLNATRYITLMKEKFDFIYTEGNFKQQYELLYNCVRGDLFINTALKGELSLVKRTVENKTANIHNNYDDAFENAILKGHLHIVKYLVEYYNSKSIRIDFEYFIIFAKRTRQKEIENYLFKKSKEI